MAYTNITNPQVAAGASINTALMTALRDNILAIAEGTSGAPEIEFTAIALAPIEYGNAATSSGDVFVLTATDLAPYGVMRIDVNAGETAGETNASYLVIRMSNNNGSTWSSWGGVLQVSRFQEGVFNGYLDLVSGNLTGTGFDEGGQVTINGNVLAGGNANAVQFMIDWGTGASVGAAVTLVPISGRTT